MAAHDFDFAEFFIVEIVSKEGYERILSDEDVAELKQMALKCIERLETILQKSSPSDDSPQTLIRCIHLKALTALTPEHKAACSQLIEGKIQSLIDSAGNTMAGNKEWKQSKIDMAKKYCLEFGLNVQDFRPSPDGRRE